MNTFRTIATFVFLLGVFLLSAVQIAAIVTAFGIGPFTEHVPELGRQRVEAATYLVLITLFSQIAVLATSTFSMFRPEYLWLLTILLFATQIPALLIIDRFQLWHDVRDEWDGNLVLGVVTTFVPAALSFLLFVWRHFARKVTSNPVGEF
jgi:hypothetical protein